MKTRAAARCSGCGRGIMLPRDFAPGDTVYCDDCCVGDDLAELYSIYRGRGYLAIKHRSTPTRAASKCARR